MALQLGYAALIEPSREVAILAFGEASGGPWVRHRRASVSPYAVAPLPVSAPAAETWVCSSGWRTLA